VYPVSNGNLLLLINRSDLLHESPSIRLINQRLVQPGTIYECLSL